MIRFGFVGWMMVLSLTACTDPSIPAWNVPDSLATRTSFFEKQVLMAGVTDPMEIAIADDGRVFMVERAGAIHLWDPATRSQRRIGYIPVTTLIEDGLLGIALDPNFSRTGWLYVFYGPADGGDSRLSRFTFDGEHVDPDSEIILLHVPMQREVCCHAAGSMTFGPDGTLYLSVGDNTDHIDRAGGPIDERPGHRNADAQFTSANTNDLRGKILRIKPEKDGSYSIPEGNLFEGDDLHRPEIYIMGLRNAFRISVDSETGWLYFADVGSGDPPNDRGGWGWDEFNQARQPGNYGWPYVVGPNAPYADYDYATETVGESFDPMALINDSPNNTGVRELPPSEPAMIWYTFGNSEEFPEVGAGGVNPMAGPVYRRAQTHGAHAFPDYYLGKQIVYDWMRNWVLLVSMDDEGNYEGMEPFLPDMTFSRPMDMEVGPDGTLYVIEWGKGFWGSNADAQVVRIVYHGSEDHPAPSKRQRQEIAAPAVAVHMPANGSFFRFDEPVAYSASVEGPAEFDADLLSVRLYSGFDTNQFLLDEQMGSSGSMTVTHAFTHVPDLHYTDRFAVLEACYDESSKSCVKRKLHPYQKEAEHTTATTSASRFTYGVQPAAAEFPETALTVMRMRANSELRYAPMNLDGIVSVAVRYKATARAALIILDEQEELARVDLSNSPGKLLQDLPQARALDDVQSNGLGHLLEGLQRTVYEGWREVIIPLPATPTSVVKLQVLGEADGTLVEIDQLRFIPQSR